MKRVVLLISAAFIAATVILPFLSWKAGGKMTDSTPCVSRNDGPVPTGAQQASHDCQSGCTHGADYSQPDRVIAGIQAQLPSSAGFVSPSLRAADWQIKNPAELSVALPGQAPLTFKWEMSATRGDSQVWRGRARDKPGAFLVLAASAATWSAVISTSDGDTYEIIAGSDGRQQLVEFKDAVHCGTCEGSVQAAPVNPGTSTAGGPRAAASTTQMIDVLFIYDDSAVTSAGGNKDLIATRMLARLEASNAVLANSQITNFTWNSLGSYHISGYTRSGKLEEDLTAISDRTSSAGSFARQKADELGADQIVFVVGDPIDWGGIAHTPGTHSVVGWTQTPYYTLTHELGHNFGCNHDRQTSAAADGDGKHSYGFRYTNARGEDTGTVMSYASNIVPYFSNPNILLDGVALGIAVGQPRAAHNAKVVTDYAPTLVAVRNPMSTPIITEQPVSIASAAGAGATLSTQAAGSGVSYQWVRNGENIQGANSRTLVFSELTSAEAGRYVCVVTNSLGSLTTQEVDVSIQLEWDSNPNARLVNLSSRSAASNDANAQFGGFIVEGPDEKSFLVRASGPALVPLGVTGTLTNPRLELRRINDQALMGENDQWGAEGMTAAMQATFDSVGAFGWEVGSQDAAVVRLLKSGAYTGVVSSVTKSTGVALIEIYETEFTPGTRLINLSTRAPLNKGNDSLIAGFVIDGFGLKTILVRGSGPALAKFLGDVLADDPVLELYDQSTGRKVIVNDNWGDDDPDTIRAVASSSGAFAWDEGSLDAAAVVTLRPGAYTAVIQCKNQPGIGLVEVYDVNK
ncbi:MAG: M12 family metallo-peptidase [Opitutaceae bacterium]|nr:M12 family metallo-peptidase [Opitutaceae bacterium]